MSRPIGTQRTVTISKSEDARTGTEDSAFLVNIKETFKLPKLIFFFSFVCIAVILFGVYTFHEIIPFIFVVPWLAFFIARIVYYVKRKWVYMIFDFAHFEMAIIFAYLLGGAGSFRMQQVCFGLANGPLIWAVIPFAIPNALAPHIGDKMCSLFVHYFPALVMATVKWFPSESSKEWHIDFYSGDAAADFAWMFAIPFSCYIIHYVAYTLVVYIFIQPADEYLTSYRYLVRDKQGFVNKVVTLCGEDFPAQYALYTVFSWLLCMMSLLFAILWYESFPANIVFLVIVAAYILWTSAYFHVDLYSKEGLAYDDL